MNEHPEQPRTGVSRRRFLGLATLGGGIALLAACAPAAPPAPTAAPAEPKPQPTTAPAAAVRPQPASGELADNQSLTLAIQAEPDSLDINSSNWVHVGF